MRIDGVVAQRAAGTTTDGRPSGLLFFPDRVVYVAVASPDRRTRQLTLLVVLVGLVAAGCGGGGGGGGGGKTIALLLPENQTARYESHDRAGLCAPCP